MLEEAHKIFLETLSNETRLGILLSLGKKSLNVTQICQSTGLNQTTISHNLSRLEKCGFVQVEQEGKYRIYSVNKETINPLLKLMNQHMKKYCKKLCACENEELKIILRR